MPTPLVMKSFTGVISMMQESAIISQPSAMKRKTSSVNSGYASSAGKIWATPQNVILTDGILNQGNTGIRLQMGLVTEICGLAAI
jgi:hypothetical protein